MCIGRCVRVNPHVLCVWVCPHHSQVGALYSSWGDDPYARHVHVISDITRGDGRASDGVVDRVSKIRHVTVRGLDSQFEELVLRIVQLWRGCACMHTCVREWVGAPKMFVLGDNAEILGAIDPNIDGHSGMVSEEQACFLRLHCVVHNGFCLSLLEIDTEPVSLANSNNDSNGSREQL